MAATDGWDVGGAAWRRLAARRDAHDADADALAALADIGTVRRMLDQWELDAVRAARQQTKSWTEIATYLGVTRQSAWERWRDLDLPTTAEQAGEQAGPAVAAELSTHAHEKRRRSTVGVPNVIGARWPAARGTLGEKGLVAMSAESDAPTPQPDEAGWVVTDQSPESGARVPAGSIVRLWLRRDRGSGVREPRRPRPTPLSVRESLLDPSSEAAS